MLLSRGWDMGIIANRFERLSMIINYAGRFSPGICYLQISYSLLNKP